MSTNETIWDNNYGHISQVNCVYPISGAYGLLPRILYYVTLIFAIFGRSKEWLIIGALVSALTYAGTTAIHMMALVRNRTGVFDLDIVAAWAVLSTGALAYIGIIHWSSTLRNSRARVVMVIWGFLIACYSSRGKLLEQPIELISPEFNCTYKCFSVSRPMRHRYEIQVIPHQYLANQYTKLAFVLVGPIQFAAYAAISIDSFEHTPSVMCLRYIMSRLIQPRYPDKLTNVVYKASMETWYGGYFALLGYIRRVKWSWMKFWWASFLIPWLTISFLIDVTCLPLMITNIVLNEVTLLAGNLPTNESSMAIGQWGPVVAAALVVIAACINKGLEMRERRQKLKELEAHGASEESASVPDGTDNDGQTTGVVMPKLAHVQTLLDMADLMKRPK
ncbi:hypothetical protein LTR10_013042 [Elasticomyces elasticus]|uniref:Uncharacterized protein n=1 Tax=Exophiala sideris TaxID=1016849 RepID=A0ABR0JCC5_9EURO|nr:hypothetical protein LTR10_013042 [Elasticomyces elasticus]KAK5030418.1 hypothetical protein LTS07_005202 [Exophiala sideris]KAK5038471.1 hypothetical protein LTR13_004218 [Exophiala sideris]KAK5060354.1 hypothetical protein LTR69_005671 [Exophiala sideris]KAK5183264.1 hypothetical protein LTR44_004265 [Eurotiomycetes sp. CCFEE 6388]